MEQHETCMRTGNAAASFSLLLRFVFLKLQPPPGCCSPEGAGSSYWGDWSCGDWTAVTPAVTTRGQRPSTAAAAWASAGRSAGGRSQPSFLLLAVCYGVAEREEEEDTGSVPSSSSLLRCSTPLPLPGQ